MTFGIYVLLGVLFGVTMNRAALANSKQRVGVITPTYVQWAWLIFVLTHCIGGSSMVNAFSGCTTHRRRYTGFIFIGWPIIIALLLIIGLVCLARLGFDKLVPQGIHMFDATCACSHCVHGLAK